MSLKSHSIVILGIFVQYTLTTLIKGVVEVALGNFNEPELTEQKFSGVYFLSKETEHLQRYIDSWKDYPQIVRGQRTDTELHEIHESADRSGYFIYQSNHKFICN